MLTHKSAFNSNRVTTKEEDEKVFRLTDKAIFATFQTQLLHRQERNQSIGVNKMRLGLTQKLDSVWGMVVWIVLCALGSAGIRLLASLAVKVDPGWFVIAGTIFGGVLGLLMHLAFSGRMKQQCG